MCLLAREVGGGGWAKGAEHFRQHWLVSVLVTRLNHVDSLMLPTMQTAERVVRTTPLLCQCCKQCTEDDQNYGIEA